MSTDTQGRDETMTSGDRDAMATGDQRAESVAPEHTPGPWSQSAIHHYEVTEPGQIRVTAQVTHYGVRYVYRDDQDRRCTVQIAQVYITAGRVAEAAYNSRLIAAAPDMLAALQQLVANILDYERVNNLSPNPGRKYCWDATERAVEAISKATGAAS